MSQVDEYQTNDPRHPLIKMAKSVEVNIIMTRNRINIDRRLLRGLHQDLAGIQLALREVAYKLNNVDRCPHRIVSGTIEAMDSDTSFSYDDLSDEGSLNIQSPGPKSPASIITISSGDEDAETILYHEDGKDDPEDGAIASNPASK